MPLQMPTLRRLGAVGILCLLVTLVVGFPAKTAVEYIAGLKEQIHDQRVLLGRLHHVIAKRDSGSGNIDVSSQVSEQMLLPGATDPVRAAHLFDLASRAARRQGVRTKSTNTLASYTTNGLRFVSVQVAMTATLPQIQNMLVELERQKPYIFVAALDISETNVAGAKPDLLDLKLNIVGAANAGQEEGAL